MVCNNLQPPPLSSSYPRIQLASKYIKLVQSDDFMPSGNPSPLGDCVSVAGLSLYHSVSSTPSLSFGRGHCPSLELSKFRLRGVFQPVEGPGLGAVESNFQGKAN